MIHSDRYTILKYSGYALLMLGLFVLQTSRGTAIQLWGAAVNAMPFFVAAVALLDALARHHSNHLHKLFYDRRSW